MCGFIGRIDDGLEGCALLGLSSLFELVREGKSRALLLFPVVYFSFCVIIVL